MGIKATMQETTAFEKPHIEEGFKPCTCKNRVRRIFGKPVVGRRFATQQES